MKYKTPTKAIITDAGFASRFLPITKTIPKAMIPIGAKPIMQLVVEECAAAGITQLIIVATPHTMGKQIYEDYFNSQSQNIKTLLEKQGKIERFKSVQEVLDFPKITVIEQDPNLPYGNASPIISARQFIDKDEAFLALYSDDIVLGASDAQSLIESYRQHPAAKAIIMAQEMPDDQLSKYGIIALKNGNKLDHIVEKPQSDPPSNLTSYGRYLLTPEIFNKLDEVGLDGELWTVDGITKLASEGDVIVEKTSGHWLTTGDPKNYLLAQLTDATAHADWLDDIKRIIK
ncbi:MAG: NTP transferase domain-containing protein [Candidatus Nomurabacteria bacterium]|jgi:UTP--glucose-1-phosphate uridylyltransferase|nr:NTP transferase domain-containing protein [Candidatus Nomurabacteria bacterium]